ncbi:Peptidase family M48 [Lentzea albidocapillata subsp. violacea]|uniref:Peptidase family M48 n=1 Tax=Lentzea albidocapillata subsp. violacea TaxID=128104 RepID=A0A1G9S4Y4_9PSEU|nr:Peptidase family M48 [Lentzea albidocapillata subsp. violacea]
MTIALALLVGALLAGWVAPALLSALLSARVHPQVSLVTWLTLVTGIVLASSIALIIALLPGHGPAPQVIMMLHSCLTAIRHGGVPGAEHLAGLLWLALVVFGAARLAVRLLRYRRHQGQLYVRHRGALDWLAKHDDGPIPTLWLPHEQPMAYSIGGPEALIIATDGLVERLPYDSVQAVLEHERAHVRGHHHLLVAVARALAATLPWLPLARCSPEFVGAVAELAADSSAARMHGTRAVRTALLSMTTPHDTPPAALAMAHTCVDLRLAHLDEAGTASGRDVKQFHVALSGLCAVTLPFALGTALFVTAALAVCPFIPGMS